MLRKVVLLSALGLPLAAPAHSENLFYFTECHTLVILPGNVEEYLAKQAARFAEPDPAKVEELRNTVQVSVIPPERPDPGCTGSMGRPERVIWTEPGGREPVLKVELPTTLEEYSNRMGARFSLYEGSATLTRADFERLRGRDFELHLIYEKEAVRLKWGKKQTAKLLDK